MKKAFIPLLVLVLSFAVVSTADARRDRVPAQLDTPGTSRTLVLPPEAANADVISLGTAIDPGTGLEVEGLMFVYKKDSPAKGGVKGPPNGGGETESSCFASLANGAKWKVTEDYLVDPTNSEGLSALTVEILIADGLEVWDSEVSTEIFGDQVAGVVDGAETQAPDNKNEVMFGDISSSGTIGVTTVWGVFKGKPSNRQLVEWDMVIDDVDYDWSAEAGGVPGKMDFANIFNHEAGHALGLGHPGDGCTEETMFRFADVEETKKRDLFDGDVSGVNDLY